MTQLQSRRRELEQRIALYELMRCKNLELVEFYSLLIARATVELRTIEAALGMAILNSFNDKRLIITYGEEC